MNDILPVDFRDNDICNFPNVNCSTLSTEDYKSLSLLSNQFSIFHVNIRSSRKNFSILEGFLSLNSNSFDVISLTETWLNNELDEIFNLHGYNKFSIYRNKNGGGISVYVKKIHKARLIEDITYVSDCMEILSLNITCGNVNFVLSCIYRPPSLSVNDFNIALDNYVLPHLSGKKSVICGDLNVNLYNPSKLNSINEFVYEMSSHNYFPLITLPTRLSPNNPITKYSLLDHIWTNFSFTDTLVSGVFDFELSDHLPVYCTFNYSPPVSITKRSYRKFNDEGKRKMFVDKINQLNFADCYDNDPNIFCSRFLSKLYEIFYIVFPLCYFKINNRSSKSAIWMNDDLKKLIKKKHKLLKLSRLGKITRRSYNTYKNLLKFLIRKTKNVYYLNQIENVKSDQRKVWQQINSVLNRKCRCDDFNIVYEGRERYDEDMANVFNNYFTSIATDLVNNLPNVNNPFEIYTPVVLSSFTFEDVTSGEVRRTILSFESKRFCKNEIQPKFLIDIVDVVSPILCDIFNMSFDKCMFPDCLKLARITPVFKSGSMQNVNNFRPIANLSIFNKIFETIINTRILKFIDRRMFMSDHQYGFKKNCTTTEAILDFITPVFKSFNDKHFTISLFLDLKKAFDTVDIDLLLSKLSHYGFRNKSNAFFKNYFNNRKQHVQINDFNSDCKSIDTGLTQGAINSPILFKLFINDLGNFAVSNGFYPTLFADDAVFQCSGSTLEDVIRKINIFIPKLSEWLAINKLTANVLKTKLMLFSPCKNVSSPDVYFNNVLLEYVNHFKYLGIFLDNKLSFHHHTNYISGKLSKVVGVMYASSPYLNSAALITIYYSLIYSVFIQSIVIYGKTHKICVQPIKVLINKVLRIILKVRKNNNNIPLMSTNLMFYRLGLLKFDDVYTYYLLKFLRKSLYSDPKLLNKYYIKYVPQHQHSTRNNILILPKCRLDIEKNSTIFQSIKEFNSLPSYLKENMSDFKFKRQYKKYILEKYLVDV